MQNILNIKLQLENQAKMEFGRQQMRLREEQDILQEYIDRKESYLEEGRTIRGSVMRASQLRENANALTAMDEIIELQNEQVAIAEERVKEARAKLQEVMQERKMHEKDRKSVV